VGVTAAAVTEIEVALDGLDDAVGLVPHVRDHEGVPLGEHLGERLQFRVAPVRTRRVDHPLGHAERAPVYRAVQPFPQFGEFGRR